MRGWVPEGWSSLSLGEETYLMLGQCAVTKQCVDGEVKRSVDDEN